MITRSCDWSYCARSGLLSPKILVRLSSGGVGVGVGVGFGVGLAGCQRRPLGLREAQLLVGDELVEGGVRAAFQLRSLLAQVGESHAITLVGAPDGGGRVDGAGGRLAETAGCRLDGGGERARGRERDG